MGLHVQYANHMRIALAKVVAGFARFPETPKRRVNTRYDGSITPRTAPLAIRFPVRSAILQRPPRALAKRFVCS